MKDIKRENSRSSEYQWKIREIPCDMMILSNLLSQERTINENYEKFYDLRQALLNRLIIVAQNCLTPRQFEILRMYYLQHLNQTEISRILKIQQNSVSKSLSGSPFIDKTGAKIQKGSLHKLQVATQKDSEIQLLLQEINELDLFSF